MLWAVAAFTVWAVMNIVLLEVPILSMLLFFLFNLLFVAMPGIALVKVLRLKLSPLAAFVTAYGLGLATVVASYFLFAPFSAVELMPIGLIAVSAVSAAGLFALRHIPFSQERDDGEISTAILFCIIGMLITFSAFSAAALNPAISGTRAYYPDMMYGAGFVESAFRGFPMRILQMSGTEHRYHPFFYCYCAALKATLKISSFEVLTKFALIGPIVFLCSSFVLLAKKLIANKLAVVLAGVLFLLFPNGKYAHYIYQDTLGFSMSVAFAILSVWAYLSAEKHKGGIFNRYHWLSLIFMVMCLGAKGPLCVALIFGICFIMLCEIIKTKKYSLFIRGAIFASVFLGLYSMLYMLASDSIALAPYYHALQHPAFSALSEWMWRPAACFLASIAYVFSIEPVMISLVAFSGLLCLKYRENIDRFAIFCFGGTICGYLLVNLLIHSGSSEVYFLTVMSPFVYIFGIRSMCSLANKLKMNSFPLAACAVLLLSIYSFPQVVSLLRGDAFVEYETGFSSAIEFSKLSQKGNTAIEQPVDKKHRSISITPLEYEAMLWIRDNTPRDSVIADGRYLTNNKYFYGSVFSERAFYLEGFGYVTMEDTNSNLEEKAERNKLLRPFFENPNEEWLVSKMYDAGCDYLLITQFMNPGVRLSDKHCFVVFENKDIAVYQIREW
ncbi:MAG: hypothetical protein RR009_02265 [Oscillospiraceae bacterium]